MAKEVKIWYDSEGDYLEVIFERKEGYQADFLFWLISDLFKLGILILRTLP